MKKIFVMSMAALAIAGCGKGRSADPIANVREASKDRELQSGAWITDCNNTPFQALAEKAQGLVQPGPSTALKSERIEYKFDGENVTRSLFRYHEADCVGDALAYSERGSIKIETDPNKRTNDQGKNIDMDFKQVWVHVTGSGLTLANTNGLCGAKNWKEGEERDVSASSGNSDCYPIKTPRKVFNVYRVMNEKGELYLGADPSGALAEKDRPTSATRGVVFKKKQ